MRFLCAAIHKDHIKVLRELRQQRRLAEMRCVVNITAQPLAPYLHYLRHNRRVLLEHQLRLKLRKGTERGPCVMDDIHDTHFGRATPERDRYCVVGRPWLSRSQSLRDFKRLLQTNEVVLGE